MTPHPGYELFEELGRGANTIVYRAYELSLGRDVAIKVLDEESRRDPRHRERFLREAQFLAQFEHDNVLRVHSVDVDRGWIIMELMKGTLASIIAAGPSDPDLVRSVLKQTLDALAFLHEKNKVHGTVRPTNLLINDAGRVKLSEFEHSDVGGELRAPKGSKKYLAPELIRPEFGEFGPPLDLYCLGFSALELLKGPQFESLFPGTGKGAIDPDIAWLRWHSSPEELASTRKLVKGIPDDLAHVLDRMLKKRVADRAQTAQEVLSELADRPLVAVPIAGAEDENAAAVGQPGFAPAVVRSLATQSPQVMFPQGSAPAAGAGAATAPAKRLATEKKPATKTAADKPAPPRFTKDWWNHQFGRPYVLYPLCAVILLGALWFSFFRGRGPTFVPVTFVVEPDATGVQVVVGDKTLKPRKDGTYGFPPGRYGVTFQKEGFEPASQEIEVTRQKNKFAVKLAPVVKWIDVAVSVTPADAQLKVDGKPQPLANGAYTHKLEEGKPLAVEASRDGYASAAQTFSPADLAKLGNKVAITLQLERAPLPKSLVAKPGAELDRELKLPVRALSTTLGDAEPMEFALVKPGTYPFGAKIEGRRPNELADRAVTISEPFYIALNEVNNTQYQKFFEAKGESAAGTRWQIASRKWAEFPKLDPVKNSLPVTNVSPEQAQAFCAWIGGRLPSEIEWEAAVRGLDDRGFPYPWGGDKVSRERAQIFHGDPIGKGFGPVPVDQLAAGANSLGLLNALGNAAEWCADSEKPGNYILRGCSFTTTNIDDIRVTWRNRGDVRGEEDTGFRVVVPLSDGAAQSELSHSAAPTPTAAAPSIVTAAPPSAPPAQTTSAPPASSSKSPPTSEDLDTLFKF